MIHRILVIFAAVGLLLSACSNPFMDDSLLDGGAEPQSIGSKSGVLSVSLGGTHGRSLVPADAAIHAYALTLTASGQDTIEHSLGATGAGELELAAGEWHAQATAHSAEGTALYTGSEEVQVRDGETAELRIKLQPTDGTGTLELAVDLQPHDDGSTDGLTAGGRLEPVGGGDAISLGFTAGDTHDYVLSMELASGYYTLRAALDDAEGELTAGVESVLIVAGAVTRGELAFSQDSSGSWFLGAASDGPGPEPDPYDGLRIFAKNYSHIHYFDAEPAQPETDWPGESMQEHSSGWRYYEISGVESLGIVFNNGGGGQSRDLEVGQADAADGNVWFHEGQWYASDPLPPEVPTVSSSPAPGRYNQSQQVELHSSNPDDVIYYTIDGSPPTTASAIYAAPISLDATADIRAVAVNRLGEQGDEAVLTYDIDENYDLTPAAVSSSMPGGSYEDSISIRLTVTDNESGTTTAYYTAEGRPATENDPVYVQGDASGSGITGESIAIDDRTYLNLLVIDAAGNQSEYDFFYNIGVPDRGDFREETIYFLMTTRFYDGDSSNNAFTWDAAKAGNLDPAWRGDFKGLVEKLDYIKALGFSAIWITPVVKNMSGYDYHGYHASNHSEVDPRYESSGYDYQRLIDEVHARDMKIIQDMVLNHTGNFGDENLHPLFETDASGSYLNWNDPDGHVANDLLEQAAQIQGGAAYADLTPDDQFQARIKALRDPLDTEHIYHHHEFKGGWEQYEVQLGSIAGDCQDLNTENPVVSDYLIDAYNQYIDMGVDSFRIDTVKHVSRLVFNREFLPAFKARGGDDFFLFGEVATRYRSIWNDGNPNISTPFFTWKGTNDSSYAWNTREEREASVRQYWDDHLNSKPESDNHELVNNTYRQPDYSRFSGQAVIDFPMHWSFNSVGDAWNIAVGGDWAYNDATWNVTYVDSHDYAPDTAPENQRYAGFWPDKLSLMFTFRGIPTIFYGTEIEFMKGAVIDVGPNAPLDETGRAYFGDHIEGSVDVDGFGRYRSASGAMADTLNHDLARHIRALNLIRRAVPALQKGQYAVDGFQAFRRRYTDENTDSFALVVLDGTHTFSDVPGGTYRDVVTGETHSVSGSATLSAGGAGNLRVWVLTSGSNQPDPGHVLQGMYPLEWIK